MATLTTKMLDPQLKKLVLLLKKDRQEKFQELIQTYYGDPDMMWILEEALDSVEWDVAWLESRYDVHPTLTKSRRLLCRLIKIKVNLENNWPSEQNESSLNQEQNSVPS